MVALDDEIHAKTLRAGSGDDADIRKIAGAVKSPKTFTFRAEVEWFADCERKRRGVSFQGMTGIIQYADFGDALAFDLDLTLDLGLLGAHGCGREEAAGQRSEG
ncbi:MAG: hypothetical protein WA608_02435 [Candidatus Acidiferrales bacterium]